MAVCSAQLAQLDQGLGQVMAARRAEGIEKNALVRFPSDNGGGVRLLRGAPSLRSRPTG